MDRPLVTTEIIPSTLGRGGNYSPTIAYDAQSGMLFVFWIHNQGMVLNQLMFTSRTARQASISSTSVRASVQSFCSRRSTR